MKTLAFQHMGPRMLLVFGTQSPSESDWSAYMKATRAWANEQPLTVPVRVLVYSNGGAPSVTQRGDLVEIVSAHQSHVKVAVAVTSTLARGSVTALSWFNPVYRAFSGTQIDEALAWLDVPAPAAREMKDALDRLRRTVVAVGTVSA